MHTVSPLLARVTATAAVTAPRALQHVAVLVVAPGEAEAAAAPFAPDVVATTLEDVGLARQLADRLGARHVCLEACANDRLGCTRPQLASCWPASERLLHNPARRARDEAFYRTMVEGQGAVPCADALTAGYRRNFALCASLARRVPPGQRVLLIAGSNEGLLRQCIAETPGLRLVEPAPRD